MPAPPTPYKRRAARALLLLIPLALLPFALPRRPTLHEGVVDGVAPPAVAAKEEAEPAPAVTAVAPPPAARAALDVGAAPIAVVTPGSPAVALWIYCETKPERHAATRCDITVSLGTPGSTRPTDWTPLTTLRLRELDGAPSVPIPPERPLRIEARSSCGRYAGAVELPAPSADATLREELETWTAEDFSDGFYPGLEVTLQLTRRRDAELTLRVVALEDGRRIQHARLDLSSSSWLELSRDGPQTRLGAPTEEPLFTDEVGVALVSLSNWLPTFALLQAESHSPRLLLLHDGNASALEDKEVREVTLGPGAVVKGTVDDRAAGALVVAQWPLAAIAEAADEPAWKALGVDLAEPPWGRSAPISE